MTGAIVICLSAYFEINSEEVKIIGQNPFFLVPELTHIMDYLTWEYFQIHSYQSCYGNMLLQPTSSNLYDFYKSHVGIHGGAIPVKKYEASYGPAYLYGLHPYNLSNNIQHHEQVERGRGFETPEHHNMDINPHIPADICSNFKKRIYDSQSTYFNRI